MNVQHPTDQPDDATASVTVGYPSTAFPSPPKFELDVPGDWHPAWVPDAELSLRSPRDRAGFHANVVVRARRVAPLPESPAEYLRTHVIGELESGGYERLTSEILDHELLPAARSSLRTNSAHGTPIDVLQLAVLVTASDELAYLVFATGSVAVDADESERAAVRTALSTLRIGAP